MSTQPASASPSVTPTVADSDAMRTDAPTEQRADAAADTATADGRSAHSAAGAAAAVGSSMLAAAVAAYPHTTAVHRVLSIQSSVIFGYVGNKASNFPLQLLGFDVDPLHSCQLSNHTGYAHVAGLKTSAKDVRDIAAGLDKNNMLRHYSHLLTGYMTSVEFLEECVTLIQRMRKDNPNIFFVCDPVMGDNGALYVPPSFVSIYRDRLIPLADVITPNQTEAEQLSGIPIRDESSAIENIEWFHRRGVRTVIITSLTYPTATRTDTATAAATTADPDAAASSTPAGVIHVLASTLEEGDSSAAEPEPLRSRRVAHMQFHHVPMYFSGTGDLSSALLLAWIVRTHQQEQQQAQMNGGTSVPPSRLSFSTLVRALELCMATLQAVIRRTFAAGSEELLLIQSKADIETPVITQRATIIDIDPK